MEVRHFEGTYTAGLYKKGLTFPYKVSVPVCGAEEFALVVEHDGLTETDEKVMLRLAEDGKAPYCVCVGVDCGRLVFADGTERNMRMDSYDLFDRGFGDFVVYELMPYLTEKYSLKISPSPDMHMVYGGSSGGLSAFAVAWFHPDYFHRIYMSSPSFLAMGRGNELPYLIRKYETKPFRIFEDYSENEPDDYFGSIYPIDIEAKNALAFANYDYLCKYYPGEGHNSRYFDEQEAYLRGEWIWKDWDTVPIRAKANSPRVDCVVPFGDKWEKTDRFPEKEKGPDVAAHFDLTAYSSDGKMIYAADRDDDTIYYLTAEGPRDDEHSQVHAYLHSLPGTRRRGPADIAVDRNDRLFALTEMGIQCVRSFGLVDVILDLPDGGKAEKIAVDDALYVKTERGIYRRKLADGCADREKAGNSSHITTEKQKMPSRTVGTTFFLFRQTTRPSAPRECLCGVS